MTEERVWNSGIGVDSMTQRIETDYRHSGFAIMGGFVFQYEGSDVNPYTEHSFRSNAKCVDGYDLYHFTWRTTYLYDDVEQLWHHAFQRLCELYPHAFKSSKSYQAFIHRGDLL